MKIQVILFGTLRNGFPDHDPVHGLEVELADGSSVADLVDHLEIPRTRLGVVSVGGVLVKADTRLKDRDRVRVFQPIAGG
ncbi:MAG: MoaD/ThiS family protein [Deltaproteobacteria bacterium]|jgi:sulfur carrier protein ThiS|nr:MoaD/ThiS family protein [Deltaproteobacteria bacterium]MBW2483636.1 MoaD/ThiS family protein [Deltaproteobacteria bacterium]